MAALSGIKPEKVFYYFEQLCSVPHGSGNTKRISDLCVGFAKELGLNDIKDSVSEYFNHLIFAPILNNVYMRALSAVTHKDYMTRRYMWKLEY